jgi:hypothetical protein
MKEPGDLGRVRVFGAQEVAYVIAEGHLRGQAATSGLCNEIGDRFHDGTIAEGIAPSRARGLLVSAPHILSG